MQFARSPSSVPRWSQPPPPDRQISVPSTMAQTSGYSAPNAVTFLPAWSTRPGVPSPSNTWSPASVPTMMRVIASSLHPVLDLPRVIEDVPRRAPDRVPRRPQLRAAWRPWRLLAPRPGGQQVDQGTADGRHLGRHVADVQLPRARAHRVQVPGVGLQHVTHDPLHLAPPAARAPPQGDAGGALRGAIERLPAGPEDRGQALRLGRRQGSVVERRGHAGRPEVRGGVALDPFGHPEGPRVGGRAERRGGGRPPQG